MFIGTRQGHRSAAVVALSAGCAMAQADCFEHHASRFSLDPALLRAIAQVESAGRPQAINGTHRSRTGTVDLGLMQINSAWLPALARHGIGAGDLMDPCTSVEVGAWILADLVRRHGNTWEAVGAYNAACSQLKGEACIRARTDYAWRVYRHTPSGARHGVAIREAAPATGPSPRRVPGASGIVSLAQADLAHAPASRPGALP